MHAAADVWRLLREPSCRFRPSEDEHQSWRRSDILSYRSVDVDRVRTNTHRRLLDVWDRNNMASPQVDLLQAERFSYEEAGPHTEPDHDGVCEVPEAEYSSPRDVRWPADRLT